MGSWLSKLSCCKGEEAQVIVEPERARLLPEQPRNNTTIQQDPVSDDYVYGSLSKESEKQASLNRILQEISSNVIDFGAPQNSIEPSEVMERHNHYTAKLQSVSTTCVANTMISLRQNQVCLLKDLPSHETMLTRNIGLPENYRGIMVRANEIQRLLSNMNVEHRGELVVGFG